MTKYYFKPEYDKKGKPSFSIDISFRIFINISVIEDKNKNYWQLSFDDADMRFPGLTNKNNILKLWNFEDDPDGINADKLMKDILTMLNRNGKSIQEAFDYAKSKVK